MICCHTTATTGWIVHLRRTIVLFLSIVMIDCLIGGSGFVSPLTQKTSFFSWTAGAEETPTVPAAPPPSWRRADTDLAPDPSIHFGQLDNGFRYLLKKNPRPEQRVSVHLYIRAGSLDETDAQRGVAHFLEHMLFNGSTHFPPGELIQYFQSIGMQFGNDANAHTGFDETVYDIILPNGDKENLAKGLVVIHDYAAGALLEETEIARERGVILAEMRSRDSSAYRTLKATLAFEFPTLLLSQRLPIGDPKVIAQADRQLLKAFYDAWYRPENMVLVMVGDFDPPLAQSLIEKQFSGFTPRAAAGTPPALGTLHHHGLEVFYHWEPEAGQTTVRIETLQSQNPPADTAWQRGQELVEALANRIVQNRLDALLKAPATPFTSAAVGSGHYLNRVRYSEISAECSAEKWSQSLGAIEQELRRAQLYGFSQAELERVKKEMRKELNNAVQEAPTRDSTALAREIIRDLSEARVTLSPAQEQALLAPLLDSLTLDKIQEAFTASWASEHRLIMVTGNANLVQMSGSLPRKAIQDAFLTSAGSVVLRPPDATVSRFPYLPAPSGTGRIASRETLEDLGITRIRFDNGVQINLKHTDYKTNEVLANLIFGEGRATEPESLPGLGLLAEPTMDASGLGGMDADALGRALAGKSTYVDFRIGETYFNFFAESVSAEMELMFQLLYAHITDPGFREEAMALARERLRQEYQSGVRSIDGMLKIEGARFLAGGDSRFGMPPFAAIDAIRMDDIRSWIMPALQHSPTELSVVGDFDEAAVIELARRYLGSLPASDGQTSSSPHRAGQPHLPVGETRRIAVKTEIPKALVVAAWQTDDFWNIQQTRRLSVLADVFSEHLRQRIRERLGASYSPYAFNQASRAYPGYGVFRAQVNVAPNQADTVLKEVNTIAANLARNGISAEERLRAIDPILTSIKEYRRTNGYWLNSVMTASSRAPQQYDWARTFLEDYQAITVEDLADLAGTYLVPERAATMIIAPAATTQ